MCTAGTIKNISAQYTEPPNREYRNGIQGYDEDVDTESKIQQIFTDLDVDYTLRQIKNYTKKA